jgi:hypothetical protein
LSKAGRPLSLTQLPEFPLIARRPAGIGPGRLEVPR